MWQDNETTVDLLGFKVHVDLIRSVVTNSNLLPLTIGVFGDLGGGKTSIMKMLERDLDPDNYENAEEKAKYEKIACLYFNGWLFEGYDDAKSAILSSVLLQLGEHKRFGPVVRDKVVSLLKSVNWMRLARLGFQEIALPALSAYITGGASIIPTLTDKVKGTFFREKAEPNDISKETFDNNKNINWENLIIADNTSSGPLDVRSFRERFANLIKESKIESLVVLIDDLDRCSPERIIDNLEAIKLFLNVEHTAFVIGADPRIVRHAIANRYKPEEIRDLEDHEAPNKLVTDYLEKLIQVPYRLPKLSPSEIETYMALLFCMNNLTSENYQKCLRACEEQRNENRYAVFGYASVQDALKITLPEELSQSLTFCSSAASLITEGLKGNPRQVKRFLNAFILRKELAKIAKLENICNEVLVKLMILEYSHPKEFLQLFNWQATQDGFLNQIQILEKVILPPDGKLDNDEEAKKVDPQWATTSMRKWIAMDPNLSDIDLRDYFWIARDRLESTFSGLSMIPPIVRRILDDLLSGNQGKLNQSVQIIEKFNEDERALILGLIEQRIQRHPEEITGFNALRALIEKGINGSSESIAHILISIPANQIPPAVGIDLLTLIRSDPRLEKILKPAIEQLKGTDSKIGKAINMRLNMGFNRGGKC